MTIEVRLFATLREHLPPESGRASARVEVPMGATLADVLDQLSIPPEKAALILVNGRYEGDRRRPLADGCVLSIWPHVAGG